MFRKCVVIVVLFYPFFSSNDLNNLRINKFQNSESKFLTVSYNSKLKIS